MQSDRWISAVILNIMVSAGSSFLFGHAGREGVDDGCPGLGITSSIFRTINSKVG
jgi:hypothetical protein